MIESVAPTSEVNLLHRHLVYVRFRLCDHGHFQTFFLYKVTDTTERIIVSISFNPRTLRDGDDDYVYAHENDRREYVRGHDDDCL